MMEPNQTAFIVKVACPDEDAPERQLNLFYAVLTEDPQSGVQIVKDAVEEVAEVTLTEVHLSQTTAQAIDLLPGYARAL
ncbi:hypothetical protein [Methylobacterium soli]|uniref:Uncharacterized protein n=1 Tax=Methylobacterium soli TaxID=553447 RepID=A0A6L3SNY6_9HYPH|nr:hypothetical protein [Methylobacterium soli]KAB1068568.1 hypothetical protein F6X53_31560 [Methylobacterium soli]GJE41801.1 hypothetical protein AEGHOMDF_0967 [Methylobacterium soli]